MCSGYDGRASGRLYSAGRHGRPHTGRRAFRLHHPEPVPGVGRQWAGAGPSALPRVPHHGAASARVGPALPLPARVRRTSAGAGDAKVGGAGRGGVGRAGRGGAGRGGAGRGGARWAGARRAGAGRGRQGGRASGRAGRGGWGGRGGAGRGGAGRGGAGRGGAGRGGAGRGGAGRVGLLHVKQKVGSEESDIMVIFTCWWNIF